MGAALILFLLGFGALAAGVLIGRYYVPDDRMVRRTARHSRAYMRAINHLLARDKDAAIEELRQVVQENIDEIEPYFALGALFRSRGEWERAIRVHQAIELREASSKKLRLRARYELGLDFRAAGMPRRATRAMEDCLAADTKHEGALRALCGLYEEQSRFGEAASAWTRLHKLRGDGPRAREHHLLVAAAQRAIGAGDLDSAKRLLRDAEKQSTDRPADGSAHFLVASAELAAARGNYKGASQRLRQALAAAPDLAPFLLTGLIEAERQLVVADLAKEQKKAESPLVDEALEIAEEERTSRRVVEAIDEIVAAVGGRTNPHLRMAAADMRSRFEPVEALTDYRGIAADEPELLPARVAAGRLALARIEPASDEIAGNGASDVVAELRALVAADGALSWAFDGVWRCGNCGYREEAFFWRCEDCRRWGSVRLDIGRAAQEPPVSPPRERRETERGDSRRLDRGSPTQALLGAASLAALPEASIESGMSDGEIMDAQRRPSLLGRVGSALSSPFKSRKPPRLQD